MKVVILGDTHFGGGYSLGKVDIHRQINSRLIDFSNTFDYVIDYLVDQGAEHLILTGDIFELRRPQASELSLFSEKMFRLSELKIHTHIVVGNHDLTLAQKATTIDVLKELKLPYVHVYSDIKSITCGKGEDVINFIFFPFKNRKMFKCNTNEEAISRLRNHLEYEIKSITKGPRVLVGHLMLEGTNISPGVLESSLSELVLPLEMFKNLDATIMGHVHPHQIIQRDPLVAYIGSMERSKFDEGKHKKYLLLVETSDKDLIFNFEELPVRNLYDIVIDQSDTATCEEAYNNIYRFLTEYSEKQDLFGSIIRLQIFMSEGGLYGFKSEKILAFLKKEFKIHHCAGIHTHVSSKRQLRKESITERIEPLTAFNEFLDLEEDSPLKQRMKELGTQVIIERCNK